MREGQGGARRWIREAAMTGSSPGHAASPVDAVVQSPCYLPVRVAAVPFQTPSALVQSET